jgi:micrococcal nuclease
MAMIFEPFCYNAHVLDVYDGDTLTVLADLGFGVHVEQKLRLNRIDAPELKGPTRKRGLASRDWLRAYIDGAEVQIRTIKDKQEKFGRYLAELYLDDVCINDGIVAAGHAVYRKY